MSFIDKILLNQYKKQVCNFYQKKLLIQFKKKIPFASANEILNTKSKINFILIPLNYVRLFQF
jgi:hypothetical protein